MFKSRHCFTLLTIVTALALSSAAASAGTFHVESLKFAPSENFEIPLDATSADLSGGADLFTAGKSPGGSGNTTYYENYTNWRFDSWLFGAADPPGIGMNPITDQFKLLSNYPKVAGLSVGIIRS